MTKYRSESKCDECEHEWVTNARENQKPPHQCPDCGSTKTRNLESWEL